MNTRTNTWNSVGTDISKAKTLEEALKLSKLDYNVVKAPLFLDNGYEVPGQYVTKQEDSNKVFGVVGGHFEIVQNPEGFAFIDNLKAEGLKYVRAGETSKFTYIIASLPKREILGDSFTPYVIFQNSHGGHSALRATITPLRLVCQNQFNIAFRQTDNKISLRHTRSVSDRMAIAEDILIQNSNYLTDFEKSASQMARKKVSKAQVTEILEATFPIIDTMNTTQQNRVEEKRGLFFRAYNDEDNQNFKGTAWGLVNAYADYTTHKPMMKDTPQALENRFVKTTLKKGIDSFLELVKNQTR